MGGSLSLKELLREISSRLPQQQTSTCGSSTNLMVSLAYRHRVMSNKSRGRPSATRIMPAFWPLIRGKGDYGLDFFLAVCPISLTDKFAHPIRPLVGLARAVSATFAS